MIRKSVIIVILGIALIPLVAIGYCEESPRVFQFTLTSDKKIYEAEDTLELQLLFKNITKVDRYVYVIDIYNAELFTITDKDGNSQSSEITVIYDIMWDEKDYKLVKAGEEYKWSIKAKIRKDKNSVIDFGDSLIRLTHPGEFEIFVTYQGWDGVTTDKDGKQIAISKELGLDDVFVGSLVSNAILIEIK